MDTFSWTRKATPHLLAEFAVGVPMHPPIAENQAEVILPVVFAPLGSSSFFGVFVQTSTNTLMVCSPISSPTSRGFCTVKRRRFNDLGEMKTCLQSRCFANSELSQFSSDLTPRSLSMRRFGQEIRFRGAGGSVTVGVSFLVHYNLQTRPSQCK